MSFPWQPLSLTASLSSLSAPEILRFDPVCLTSDIWWVPPGGMDSDAGFSFSPFPHPPPPAALPDSYMTFLSAYPGISIMFWNVDAEHMIIRRQINYFRVCLSCIFRERFTNSVRLVVQLFVHEFRWQGHLLKIWASKVQNYRNLAYITPTSYRAAQCNYQ